MRQASARISASLVILVALPTIAAQAASAAPRTAAAQVPAAALSAATSAYQPLATPQRLIDTRDTAMLNPGDVLTVSVTGAAPLLSPGTAVAAAVLNVTAVGPTGIGYFTLYPHGTPLPNSSNLNVDGLSAFLADGLALANMVTVPVGSAGAVDVFSSAGGNVIIDLLGYYLPTAGPVAAGRFVALTAPSRMLDTRTTATAMTATETRTYAVPAAAGASAVVLNVTTVGQDPGYWQVFPTGSKPPATSNLNTMYSGQVASNQVIVPVDANGQFSAYSSSGGDLIIDVIGWFTGASAAPPSTAGLFVPLSTPTRFLDSRDPALNPLGGTKRLLPGWDLEVPVATNAAIARADVAAVVFNLTVNNTLDVGYVSVTPAGSNNPAVKARSTSSMNVSWAGQTLAAQVTVPVSARGFDVFAQNPTDVIADVSGYYLGAPVAAAFGAPQNTDPTPPLCETFAYQAIIGSGAGATGLNVSLIQQRLTTLGFWNGGTSGVFSWSTQQAVMAYQKWNGLAPLGFVDGPTAHALNWPNCRATASLTNQGDLMEVDKGRQLGFFVRNGQTLLVLNVSTGGGYFYEADNQLTGAKISGTAITDDGTFHIYRVYDQPVYKGTLGTLYRPRFVVGGIAVHGAPNVPGYPASHGCIRVSNPAMDMIWALDLLPMGSKVVVHE
jgi:hypothetical protein